jgi:hypothetical protein
MVDRALARGRDPRSRKGERSISVANMDDDEAAIIRGAYQPDANDGRIPVWAMVASCESDRREDAQRVHGPIPKLKPRLQDRESLAGP